MERLVTGWLIAAVGRMGSGPARAFECPARIEEARSAIQNNTGVERILGWVRAR
jgi:hypothetical protein